MVVDAGGFMVGFTTGATLVALESADMCDLTLRWDGLGGFSSCTGES